MLLIPFKQYLPDKQVERKDHFACRLPQLRCCCVTLYVRCDLSKCLCQELLKRSHRGGGLRSYSGSTVVLRTLSLLKSTILIKRPASGKKNQPWHHLGRGSLIYNEKRSFSVLIQSSVMLGFICWLFLLEELASQFLHFMFFTLVYTL